MRRLYATTPAMPSEPDQAPMRNYREVGDLMGLSPQAVHSFERRALNKLVRGILRDPFLKKFLVEQGYDTSLEIA